jgi:hypothetical protein
VIDEDGTVMSDLLELAVAAHGGLARWKRFRVLRAKMAIRGTIFEAKRIAGLQDDVTYEVQLREERVTVDRFGGPNRRLRFLPSRLVLESFAGDIIDTRDNPRDAFKGHTADLPWDALHLGYFSSYALWTYLNLPFLYTYPGFVVEEIAPWREAGEEWRRLKATFPKGIASHAREQVTFFGPDGLMRRHDYTVEVLGGATGANYSTNYREFQGIKVPTTRRVYAYDAQGQKVPEPVLVAIDIEGVSFS